MMIYLTATILNKNISLFGVFKIFIYFLLISSLKIELTESVEAAEFYRRITQIGGILTTIFFNSYMTAPLNFENVDSLIFSAQKFRQRRHFEKKNFDNFHKNNLKLDVPLKDSEIDSTNFELMFTELDKKINSFAEKKRWQEIAIVS